MDVSNTQQAAAEPKTFMQRFLEIEQIVVTHDGQLQDANQAFTLTAKMLESTLAQLREVNEQLHAVYVLSEAGEKVSREAVANKIRDLQVDRMKALIAKDLADGVIASVDAISNPNDIIVFSSKDFAYGHKPLSGFESEELKAALLGKKVGDTVEDLSIIGIYTLIKQSE